MRALATVASLAALLALGIGDALALDVPVPGKRLKLRASPSAPAKRRLTFKSAADPAVAAPLPDPALGATLRVFTSNGPGQCRIDAVLPAARWSAVRGDGPNRGWRYDDPAAEVQGIRKVILRVTKAGGRLVVKGKGAALPCALDAPEQHLPMFVQLELADVRYCAAFGGTVAKNVAGRLRARAAPAPAACLDPDVTLANLNVLHGLFCPVGTEKCRIDDRLDLLRAWIVERGCPDVVALQEVDADMVPRIDARLLDACPFPYERIYVEDNTVDDSLVLARHPALDVELIELHVGFRNVLRTRLDHPVGPVDVYSTHLASGSDFGNEVCSFVGPCPPECIAAGAVTIRDCQAVQVAEFVDATAASAAPAFVVGDFNAVPGSFVHEQFTARGWPDTYLAVGNPECDAASGVGCTSGREDQDLSEMESTALGVDRRIDFVFLVPPGPGAPCTGALDGPADDDGDGVATRLFADLPNPFGACGPLPAPMCWVSDHTGVQVDLNCGP